MAPAYDSGTSETAQLNQAEELQRLLHTIDTRTDLIGESQLYAVFRELLDRIRSASLEPSNELRAEIIAFQFAEDRSGRGSKWGAYFGPVEFQPGPDGTLEDVPSLAGVTVEILGYWSKRARDAKHPIARGRYGDLTWEIASLVSGAKRNHEGARIAIEAALEIADRGDATWALGRSKLSRALSLASALKDSKLEARVGRALLAFAQRTADEDKPGTWVYPFDLLVDASIQLEGGEVELVITDLEARLSRFTDLPEGEMGDPWSARKAAERLASYYRKRGRAQDVRRVLLAMGSVFERNAKVMMPMVGMLNMRELYGIYHEFGLAEDARALDPLLASLGQGAVANLKPLTTKVEIPLAAFDDVTQAVVVDSFAESLDRLAVYFVIDPDQEKREVLRLAQVAPLQALLRQVHVDARGQPESEVGSVEDDLAGRVVSQMAHTLATDSVFLRHAVKAVAAKFGPTTASLLGHITACPLFEAPQHGLVERALRAYLESDWAAFAHLIVPQLEQAIRRLVVAQGGSHQTLNRHTGLPKLRTLDDLLRDPKVEQAFGTHGPRIVRHLQVVLTDQRGMNLRNAVCHGLLSSRQFGPELADRLLHTVLVIALLHEDAPPTGGVVPAGRDPDPA